MDTQGVELLLEQLGIEAPPHVASARRVVDQLGAMFVPLRPQLSRAVLAAQLRAYADRGEDVDIVQLVRENRSGADNAEAAQLLREAQVDAERLLELAVAGSVSKLIPAVRERIAALYAEVGKLPADAPSSADDAVHRGPAAVEAFRALEALSKRHTDLRRLHKLLLADSVQPAALAMFSDTQISPPAGDWPTTRQPAAPSGPRDAIARTLWLADAKSQAWVPTAAELNERFADAQRELQAPAGAETRAQS